MCAAVKNYRIYRGKRKATISTQKYLFIMLFALFTQFKLIKNEKNMKISSMQCKSVDVSFLNITTCKMKAIERDIVEISIKSVLLKKPLTSGRINAYLRKRGHNIGEPIAQFTVDGCKFIRNKKRNMWAALLYNLFGLEKYSNLNHTCPYNHDIVVDKYPFNTKDMVKFIPFPAGHYTLSTWWSNSKIVRAAVIFNFQIIET